MSALLARRDRTAPVIARFRAEPFSWTTAGNCVHLARAQLAAFGHKVPKVPLFRSPLGAKRAMEKRGFTDLAAMMDRYAPRISPAKMWVGDIAMLPGEPFDALAIYVGSNTIVAWHGNDPEPLRNIVVTAADIKAAWRVELVR
jgi:hypothetical protein